MPVPGLIERVKIIWGLPIVATAVVYVIALFLGVPVICTKVPLADMAGDITGWLQHFSDGYFPRFHPQRIAGDEELAIFAAGEAAGILFVGGNPAALEAGPDPVGDTEASGVATGLYGGPGGGADGTGCVCIGEAHAFSGKPIQVWGFKILTSLAGKVHPSEVIDKDQDKIEGLCSLKARAKGKKGQES